MAIEDPIDPLDAPSAANDDGEEQLVPWGMMLTAEQSDHAEDIAHRAAMNHLKLKHRTLPSAVDAERDFVNGAIAHPNLLEEAIAEGIQPSHFVVELWRRVFETITKLRAQGEPIDLTTVLLEMKVAGLDRADEVSISEHVANMTRRGHVPLAHLARVIREKAQLRDFVDDATTAVTQALFKQHPAEVIELAEHQLKRLRERYDDRRATPMKRALLEAKQRIKSRQERALEESPLGGINAAQLVREPVADVEWVIRGMLQREAVGLIGAEYKGCKSWLACEIAVAMSTGEPLLGKYKIDRPGWVLYIAFEDGPRNMRSRLRAIALGRRMDPDHALKRIQVIPRPSALNIATIEGQAWVIAHALNMPEPPELIILDPLGNAHAAKDENASAEMMPVMNGLRVVRDTLRTSLYTAHHMGKPQNDKGKGRIEHRLRGSTSIFQAVDAWALIDHKKEEQSDAHRFWGVTIVAGTREGGGGKVDASLDVRLKDNGTAHTAGWALTGSEGEQAQKTDAKALDDKIVAKMNEIGGWLTTPVISKAVGYAEKTVRTHLNDLEALKRVERRGENRSTEWRSLEAEEDDEN